MRKGFPVPDNDWQALNIRLEELTKELGIVKSEAVTKDGMTVAEKHNEPTVVSPISTSVILPKILGFSIDPMSAVPIYKDRKYCRPIAVTVFYETENADLPLTLEIYGAETKIMIKVSLNEASGECLRYISQESSFLLKAKNINGEVTSNEIVFEVTSEIPKTKPGAPIFTASQGLTLGTPISALRIYRVPVTLTFTGNADCKNYEVEFYNNDVPATPVLEKTTTLLGRPYSTYQIFIVRYVDSTCNIAYKARARGFNEDDVYSDWSAWATASLASVSTAPTTPTVGAAVHIGGATYCYWTRNTEADMNGGNYLLYCAELPPECSNGGINYICIAETINHAPPNATYWVVGGDGGIPYNAGTTYKPYHLMSKIAHPQAWAIVPLETWTEDLSFKILADTIYYWALSAMNAAGVESGKSSFGSSGVTNWKNLYIHAPTVKIKDIGGTTVKVDDLTDSTYARILAAILTSGKIDFSKRAAGMLYANADNIDDGATSQLAGGALGYSLLEAGGVKAGTKIFKTLAKFMAPNSRFGKLKLYNDATHVDHQRHIEANFVVFHDNATPNDTILVNTINQTNDIDTTGAGGRIATESAFASEYAHFFVLYKSSDGTMSSVSHVNTVLTDGELATLGYDYYFRAGPCYIDGSGDLYPMKQIDDRVYAKNVQILNDAKPSLATTWEAISLAAFVPTTAKTLLGTIGLSGNTVAINVSLSGGTTDADPTLNIHFPATIVSPLATYLLTATTFELPIYYAAGVPYIYWYIDTVTGTIKIGIRAQGFVDDI